MMTVPSYLTRYYTQGEDPFVSLTMLDTETVEKEATIAVKSRKR